MTTPKDPAVEYAREFVHESLRLKELSNEELIKELMKHEFSDEPVVSEILNRWIPGWLERL